MTMHANVISPTVAECLLLETFPGTEVVFTCDGDGASLEAQARQVEEWNAYNHDRQKGTKP